jgi:hypothetical protein
MSGFCFSWPGPGLKKVFRDVLIELDKAKYMDPKMTTLDEKQLIDSSENT